MMIIDLTRADRVGKQYLVDYLVTEKQFSREDATEAVNGTLDAVVKALRAGVSVALSNIGTLRRDIAPAQKRRNPLTGETFQAPARQVIRWKSSPTILDVINGRDDRDTLSVKAPKGSIRG